MPADAGIHVFRFLLDERHCGASALARHTLQITAVFGALETGRQTPQLLGVDESAQEGDLLHAGDLQPLPALHDAHELGRLEQGFMGARVEPGKAPAQPLDPELAGLEITAVDISDLQFAARRRPDLGSDIDHMAIKKIKARRGPVRLRLLRLLLDGDGHTRGAEFDYTIAFRVIDPVGEDSGALAGASRALQQLA